ncbi:MAG: glycosyltransferase [Oscillospiraceae bacterium]|jgi:tetratricopeptide (TPR) repeat protein|nr:glycosyltransferase [Oscillospiraceae bacterium]
MPTISLCMIVKNEEEVLARCLESAKDLVDEIIIVDTGSTDKTKEIAARFTEQVYDFEWIDHFAAARNFAFSKGTSDYLMWLDADDIILPDDAKAFLELKESLAQDVDTVMLKYNIAFDEQGKPTFSYYRERILRRCPRAHWEGAVHEVITPFGKILHSPVGITHKRKAVTDPQRNLRLFERLVERGETLGPREQFYYARELFYNARYQDAVDLFEKFLSEGRGWVENNIEACRVLGQCLNALGRQGEALQALLRSFQYDSPRAELCCEIGAHYFTAQQYEQAIHWYQSALQCPRKDTGGGFTLEDCHGYLPHLQLCVCYDRLGQRSQAIAHNEEAGKLRPQSPAYLHNVKYFAGEK